MDYAVIENGVVENLIWLHPMNADTFPDAVPIGNYPVAIGDSYADGLFYRDGKRVKSNDEIAEEQTADMRSALNLLGVNADE